MIARGPSVGAVRDDAGKTAELIPDRSALAVGDCGAFDLKGTAGDAPDELDGNRMASSSRDSRVVHLAQLSFCFKEYQVLPLGRFHFGPFARCESVDSRITSSTGGSVDARSTSGGELKNCLRGSIAELADRLSYAGQRRKPVCR